MKFHVTQIRLWLRDNTVRDLHFKPNKVNVITGKSGTGKSSIITIIDYCLLGSESKLVEAVINENVEWYGVAMKINDKDFFVARKKMIKEVGSDEIYMSTTGIIPEHPQASINIEEARKIIEQEFSIDNSLVIPYGGKKLKAGSKISYRYFLLYITQSSNIILNPNVFFDYDLYDSQKYREALDRIFHLSIGVDTVERVLIKDRIAQIDKEFSKFEKQKKLLEREKAEFDKKILLLIQQAQEYDLIEKKLFTIDEGLIRLKQLVFEFKEDRISTDLSEIEVLYQERRNLGRKIRNLRSFDVEYAKYKENLKSDKDSLLPIQYIQENYTDIITIPEIKSFVEGLTNELSVIQQAIEKKRPFSTDIKKDIVQYEKELVLVTTKIREFPIQTKNFEGNVAKFIFIGELRAKLEFYSRELESEEDNNKITALSEEYDQLLEKVNSNADQKTILLQLLQERVQNYISTCSSIDNYTSYKAYINDQKKILQLREPNSSSPANIGSSSNHMFLHLFLFLGLHEHFIREKIPFVPQMLIFDQLSQPYYEEDSFDGEKIIRNDDKQKLTEAFSMLNNFIEMVNTTLNNEFQIIVLEHASRDYWENANLKHFYLVEEFRNGNALIPARVIDIK